jgi:AraC-like DNA-binding protein
MLDSLAPAEGLRLDDLAGQHGMSIRSMTRHFRLTFGTTIIEYVAARRMEKASAALEDGLSIDQAAYIAGFGHTTNFSAAFRRRYGHPPGKRPKTSPRA